MREVTHLIGQNKMINTIFSLTVGMKIFLIAIAVIAIYVLICFFIVLFKFINMAKQNKNCRRIQEGKDRFNTIEKAIGKASYNLYSDEEIKLDKSKEGIKLYYFPANENDIQTTDYCLLVPGGGYYSSDPALVSFGCAEKLNQKGINCFVMNYRVKKDANNQAPLLDLIRALEFINNNLEKFKVNNENYNLIGFSAGGHLVSLFSTKYEKLGFKKPSSISLIYPWVSLGKKIKITGNVVYDIFNMVERKVGLDYFLKSKRNKEMVDSITVLNHIDKSFPPSYILHGDSDFVVNHKTNSEELIKVLKEKEINYKYNLVPKVNHGFGIGINTNAEGWLDEAYDFWNNSKK